MFDYLHGDFNELYYGTGLDEDLTPTEFVVKLHEAADQWLVIEGPEAWSIYHFPDEEENEED